MITVNRRDYEAPKPDMTGREIKEMADAPAHHALILVAGPGGDPGGGDRPVPDDTVIHLERGMRFRTVNRAEFGAKRGGRRPAGRPRMATGTGRGGSPGAGRPC